MVNLCVCMIDMMPVVGLEEVESEGSLVGAIPYHFHNTLHTLHTHMLLTVREQKGNKRGKTGYRELIYNLEIFSTSLKG